MPHPRTIIAMTPSGIHKNESLPPGGVPGDFGIVKQSLVANLLLIEQNYARKMPVPSTV